MSKIVFAVLFMSTMAGAADFKALIKPSKENVDKGAAVYAQNCVSCHGASGHGDGAAAAALTPKPRNFAVGDGWKNGRTLTAIFKSISNGIPGGAMTAYTNIPMADRVALAHYIRSIGSGAPAIDEAKELSAIESFAAANDTSSRVRLPLELTIDRMSSEQN